MVKAHKAWMWGRENTIQGTEIHCIIISYIKKSTLYILWLTMHMPFKTDLDNKRKKEAGKWKEKNEKRTTLPEWRRGYEKAKSLSGESLCSIVCSFDFYWVGELFGDCKRGRTTTSNIPSSQLGFFYKFAVFSVCFFIRN